VSGVRTVISSPSGGTYGFNTISGRASGSSITHYCTGSASSTVTDTSITGNLYGGIEMYADSIAAYCQIDDWSLDDELSGGGASGGVAAFIGDRGFF